MKKTALFVALLIVLNMILFSNLAVATEDKDLKATFVKVQDFAVERNRFLSDNLENMMSLLGQEVSYNQVKELKKTISDLLENSKKMTALAGEVLKKEELTKEDTVLYIKQISPSLATIAAVSAVYHIILSKEKRKIERILEKLRKEKDNRSAQLFKAPRGAFFINANYDTIYP